MAKTATGLAKPGGIARLTRHEWVAMMSTKPVTALWGIGSRTATRLEQLGIATVDDLARADHTWLAKYFGPTIGPHLRLLALGGGNRPIVDEPHVARGRSKEETFVSDIDDRSVVAAHVERLAREVTEAVAGTVYCATVEACHAIFDMRRAHEWTAALDAWCAAQPDLVFRGQCLIYRAELMRFHGDWTTAADEVERARAVLAGPPVMPAIANAVYRATGVRVTDLPLTAEKILRGLRNGAKP